ncbi:NurA domain protein [Isosphaera pallida ATCC 43644]|uniref:NurA domain protein n=1 Tax=Isosphaera pallida (strain ATCC 43644 / DSM 9630 / IS1B) TaxID=575540 RepID=E8R623_ISOPI|nr:DNA double-strand break repair nuclease NurA [Isosphaera pallida]ADV63925.1 NurA domain protein [Isosphaera pallida ATCC 43644]
MEAFADLPDALVQDLLAKALPVAEGVNGNLQALRKAKTSLRTEAEQRGWIQRKADLDVTREPSVVGIDGSYQVHRLTAVDLCAAASVAVEGTSKEAKRHWEKLHHRMWVESLEHSKNVTNTLRGLMISMELDLAAKAPHDLVLLDGSFIILLIYLNQGLNSVGEAPRILRDEFQRRWRDEGVLDRFVSLLASDRTVAVPKYSGRNELADLLTGKDLPETDGKTLATLILSPGEYTAPEPIYHFGGEDQEYHLPKGSCPAQTQKLINQHLADMRVIFFRPCDWVPAIRLELPKPIASSLTRLSMVLHGIERQFFSPAVVEPYPLFLADRMVKSLGAGVAVVEQAVAQHVAGDSPDGETTILFLQNYRTEGGRGG